MQDVAALAGVSLKSVSRVVNGESGVSETLAKRVTEHAQNACAPDIGHGPDWQEKAAFHSVFERSGDRFA